MRFDGDRLLCRRFPDLCGVSDKRSRTGSENKAVIPPETFSTTHGLQQKERKNKAFGQSTTARTKTGFTATITATIRCRQEDFRGTGSYTYTSKKTDGQTNGADNRLGHFTPMRPRPDPKIGRAAVAVYWAPAYRTPPVRGEDRVHLSETLKLKVLTNLLSPAAADPGHDHEGGPSMAEAVSRSSLSGSSQPRSTQASGQGFAACNTAGRRGRSCGVA